MAKTARVPHPDELCNVTEWPEGIMADESTYEDRARVDATRRAITDVLLETDFIKLQTNPHIQAEYEVKIGCWQNELLKAQLEARRARRRAELAQKDANAGIAIDKDSYENALDLEFADWSARIEEAKSAYIAAIDLRQNSIILSESDALELKHLHHVLIKRLHPDLHPALDESGKHLFLLAQAAFEAGDLETLRSLEVATSSMDAKPENPPASQNEAVAELALLEAQLAVVEEQLEALEKTDPYALKDLLEDAQWVCDKVGELQRQIDTQREAKRRYDLRFEELRRGVH